MKRVLVTGPVEHIEEYAQAARRAGWEAIEHPLLRFEPRPFEASSLRGERFDWVCVTSGSALPYLEAACASLVGLRETPCAVVGPRTAGRVQAMGLRLAFDPAPDAAALASALRERAGSGARVLWPRGSLSDDLARELRASGIEVEDPVAYSTRTSPVEGPPPAAEAVFLASPSAVRAWCERPGAGERRLAIAIGGSTFDALLQETEARFFDTISLPQPSPEAFAQVLAHIDLETST